VIHSAETLDSRGWVYFGRDLHFTPKIEGVAMAKCLVCPGIKIPSADRLQESDKEGPGYDEAILCDFR
jgi:hypothetical protein